MGTLKVPSVQHLARNWRSNPEEIAALLVRLTLKGPTFNYSPLLIAIRDMLVFRQPSEQLAEAFRRGIARGFVRDNLLEVLKLVEDHFGRVNASFVQSVEPRYYPLSRDLLVPFQAPIVYGAAGRLYFPWFSFWRSNPLSGERLSLFVSIVEHVISNDPDLESARFDILDFSAPGPKQPRQLRIIDARDVPRLSAERRVAMLSVFSEGFRLAKEHLAQIASRQTESGQTMHANQPSLFDQKK